METLYLQITETVGAWIEACLGRAVSLRLSKKAMLACADFIREDTSAIADRLAARRAECSALGTLPVRSVRADSGWLLFDLDASYFDAFSLLIPDCFDYGNAYVDKRMEMFLKHGDSPLPAYDPVLKGILTASFASSRNKWTQDDERTVLTMTHALSGMDRVRTEHALARAAKIILYERRKLS